MSVRIPSTNDSTNVTIPRTIGSRKKIERREAELEKLAQDAKEKRSSRREEMLKEQENDDTLDHLDHFFDDEDKGKEK